MSALDNFLRSLVPAGLYQRHKISKHAKDKEPELLLLAEILGDRVKTAVDVGANRGYYSYALSRICRNVVAFEPNPSIADFARKRLPANVVVHQMALSSRDGEATLTVLVGDDGHRFHDVGSIESRPNWADVDTFTVAVRTLDSFGLKDVDFIKIDVEGAEMDVIEGAANTIRQWRPIILAELLAGYHDGTMGVIGDICSRFGYTAKVATAGGFADASEETIATAKSRNVLFYPTDAAAA